MSIARFNRWENVNGVLSSTILQSAYVSSSTRTTVNSTSFVEASSNYRVSITPRFSTSLIFLHYYIPVNPGANYATNTIFSFRAFRSVGGTKTYTLFPSGTTNGNRQVFAGITIRPPGYDLNDPMWVNFITMDLPGTTSACEYGFECMRESGGTGTLYFGYSAGDSSIWGFDHDILIMAQEIAQ